MPRRGQGSGRDEAACPEHYAPERRSEHAAGHARTRAISAGLDGVFQARRNTKHPCWSGWADPPSAENLATQTVETGQDDLSGTSRSGSSRVADTERRRSRQTLVVGGRSRRNADSSAG